MRIRLILLSAVAFAVFLPAAAQVPSAPASPLYDAIRDAGASPGDAAGLARAVQQAQITPGDAAASDRFGISISISGDRALVGANGTDALGPDSGAAYVFIRSGGMWVQEAKLTASDGAANNFFGNSVSLQDDRAVVGANGNETNRGAVYVFVRSGTTWTQEARLTASDGSAQDQFGASVALAGDRLLAGAPYDDGSKGSAYVFVRSGSTWTQETRLSVSTLQVSSFLGVSVSFDGDRALLAASGDRANGVGNAGSAFVFVRSGTTWSQEAKLTASDMAVGDRFGTSASLSGSRALIGARADDDRGVDSGSAYIFVRSGGTWTQEAKLTASDGAAGDLFGINVALLGDRALVGANGNDALGSNSGAAYVFVRSGSTWTQDARLSAAGGAAGDEFGIGLALSDDRAFASSIFDDTAAGADAGSVTVFAFEQTVTVPSAALFNPTAAPSDGRGYRLLGAPVAGFDVTDLAAVNLVQGIPAGANAATHPAQYANAGHNLYTAYTGDGTYTRPATPTTCSRPAAASSGTSTTATSPPASVPRLGGPARAPATS